MSVWPIKCNHCGETMKHVDDMRPCCSACRDAGHESSLMGCTLCRHLLEEDLRNDAQKFGVEPV